jgi:hypothetical protein
VSNIAYAVNNFCSVAPMGFLIQQEYLLYFVIVYDELDQFCTGDGNV